MKKQNYKLFILMSFLLLGGCTAKHKNVVTGVGTIDKKPMLLVEDVEDKKERIFYMSESYKDEHGFTHLGDTVTIAVSRLGGGPWAKTEKDYQLDRVFAPLSYGIQFNDDSIRARRNRRDAHNDSIYAASKYKELEQLKQQITPSAQNTK